MDKDKIVLRTQNAKITQICRDYAKNNGNELIVLDDLSGFMLELQEEEHCLALFENRVINEQILEWIRVVRNMRPKTPLIIIGNEIDKYVGGKVHETGIFFLCNEPINETTLTTVMSSAIKRQYTNHIKGK